MISMTEEDRLELLSEAEVLEFVEFNPSVEPEDARQPPKQMESFLEKHFNRALTPSERKAILKDFPKPCSKPLEVPKLDEQVKEHIKGIKERTCPHYGQEKSLYKIQGAVLDVAGPLTCLWGDLLNEEAKYSKQGILMPIQRSLVLLGSASRAISQERRKIAWSHINPKLKSLADEDYRKRIACLSLVFWKKAPKRLDVDKTIRKIAQSGPQPKKARYSKDTSDLRHFLDKLGATTRYGSGRFQRHQPYQPPKKFQSKRYFQQSKTTQAKTRPSRSDPGQGQD